MESRKTTTISSLDKTIKAFRRGNHATIYELKKDPNLKNRDVIRNKRDVVFPFVGGSSYKGQ